MDLGGMAKMLQSMTGEGGENGLSSLLGNPGMMKMVQQFMADGQMEQLMQNPSVANMVGHLPSRQSFSRDCFPLALYLTRPSQMNRVQSGGGMPSMAEIMADPNLREL
jgi:hypothetical protein